jgi:hypothetical protein
MIYNRGTYGSQQMWANIVGDDAWTFDNLLPYFAKVVTRNIAKAWLIPGQSWSSSYQCTQKISLHLDSSQSGCRRKHQKQRNSNDAHVVLL